MGSMIVVCLAGLGIVACRYVRSGKAKGDLPLQKYQMVSSEDSFDHSDDELPRKGSPRGVRRDSRTERGLPPRGSDDTGDAEEEGSRRVHVATPVVRAEAVAPLVTDNLFEGDATEAVGSWLEEEAPKVELKKDYSTYD